MQGKHIYNRTTYIRPVLITVEFWFKIELKDN